MVGLGLYLFIHIFSFNCEFLLNFVLHMAVGYWDLEVFLMLQWLILVGPLLFQMIWILSSHFFYYIGDNMHIIVGYCIFCEFAINKGIN